MRYHLPTSKIIPDISNIKHPQLMRVEACVA